MTDTDVERYARSTRVKFAQRRVERAEAALAEAISGRDALIVEVHGKKNQGFLSYQDMVDATGGSLSKGRIIQIAQAYYKEHGMTWDSEGDGE